MEGKRGTEAALSLFLFDEIESVVTGVKLTQAWSDEQRDLAAEVGAYFWWEEKEDLREEVVLRFEEKDRMEALEIEMGTEQAGKTVKQKGSWPWANVFNKRRIGLRTGPTYFTGE